MPSVFLFSVEEELWSLYLFYGVDFPYHFSFLQNKKHGVFDME